MAKYKRIDRIGSGAYGEVFRARLMGTAGFSRTVAIKRIHAQWSRDEGFASSLIKEAHIASRLQHPNIVSVLELYHDEAERLCLAMELVHGVSLSALIKSGPTPFAVVIYLVTEALRGLGHAHSPPFEIVHRDVSPRNILVAWNGAVKIADFGIARAQAETGQGPPDIQGTPDYVSPEHLEAKRLDGRADLFAVGVILYELLTGRRPFRGEGFGELFVDILFGELERPRDLRPEIPEELEAVTMRLLERDRERRYAGAQAAIDDLLACEHATPRARDELVALLAERFSTARPRAAHEPAQRAPELRVLTKEWPPNAQQDRQPPVEHRLEADKEVPPTRRRRGWLTALAVGAALAVALPMMWPTSSNTQPGATDHNLSGHAPDKDGARAVRGERRRACTENPPIPDADPATQDTARRAEVRPLGQHGHRQNRSAHSRIWQSF